MTGVKTFHRQFVALGHVGHHWQYLYSRRARWHGVSTKQIVFSQMFTVVASGTAGFMLDFSKENLTVLVGVLVMLPGIIDLAATITGSMCAKIHHHLDKKGVQQWVVVTNAVLFALLLGVLAGLIVGVVGGGIAAFIFGADFFKMILLTLLSMFLIGLVCYPFMAGFTLLVRRLGLNPDNIAGPVESSVVDIVAILIVAIVAAILS